MDFSTKFNSFPLPGQNFLEWKNFLIFVQNYFLVKGVDKPIVVEIGIKHNRQKPFYLNILNAEHIGVDYDTRYAQPEIFGNTTDPKTFQALKKVLDGRLIDLLFIDGNHRYEYVLNDFNVFGAITKHLICFHDIMFGGVKKLWGELFQKADNNYAFLTFYNGIDCRKKNVIEDAVVKNLMGIGVLVNGKEFIKENK
jgi:hypothetical protein